MVLAQWFERGLGQMLAPDHNYQDNPDRDLWQGVAPDPQFPHEVPLQAPPRRVLDKHQENMHVQKTTKCVHCQLETPILAPQEEGDPTYSSKVTFEAATPKTPPKTPDNNAADVPQTVFLSPTPKKARSGRKATPGKRQSAETIVANKATQDKEASLTETEQRILQASHDTFHMTQRNTLFKTQADKLLKFCSSTKKVDAKVLDKTLTKLLEWNQCRLQATNDSEPNVLTEARSWNMGMACPNGLTPLMACAKANQVETAQRLLQNAAELGVHDELLQQTNLYGQTALHIAASGGQVEMAELLRKAMEGDTQDNTQDEEMKEATPQQQASSSSFTSPPLVAAEDITGLTAWGTVMTSPNPKARRNKDKLDRLLASPAPCSSHKMKQNHQAPSLHLEYATAHLDGQRVLNEDALLCQPLGTEAMLFLVCDGHGDQGSVAHFVAQHLPQALLDAQQQQRSGDPDEAYWTKVCQTAATRVDDTLKQAHLAGGSTAVWAIVTERQIVVANVGDSRCLLLRDDTTSTVVPMSYDHKPDLPGEQTRIEQAGLSVIHETVGDERISKVRLSDSNLLGMSRCFGDFEYKTLPKDAKEGLLTAVICTPDVHVVNRQANRDLYLVLACDGVWDVQSNNAVSDFVLRSTDKNSLAANGEALLNECLHSGDNLSLILVAFAQQPADSAFRDEAAEALTSELQKLTLSDTSKTEDEETSLMSKESADGNNDNVKKTLVFASPEKMAGTPTAEA